MADSSVGVVIKTILPVDAIAEYAVLFTAMSTAGVVVVLSALGIELGEVG